MVRLDLLVDPNCGGLVDSQPSSVLTAVEGPYQGLENRLRSVVLSRRQKMYVCILIPLCSGTQLA